ncbi:MAG TPA: 2,3-bisphosphoglycerate-independent phosphoglycerate mutase [bacterium]|nr:2,3-bisphosphoglycerate-independent phosphoglycerate mutase [bacterium]
MKKPLILIILDGWGINESPEHNAIAQARTPNYDAWLQEYPGAALDASGHSVGLPEGVMGNSEVGHLNIGAGRIAMVGLTRIYGAIEDGGFFHNPALLAAVRAAKQNHSTLHLMGLLSDGGVHSHQDHLFALLKLAKQEGLQDVAIHAFLDGRDTPPESGLEYLQRLEEEIQAQKIGTLATVTGRYYAMDRDKRWERTEEAYRALVEGLGEKAQDARAAVAASYAAGRSDEFVKPIVLTDGQGRPQKAMKDGDAVIFFNFRADRARQLTYALTQAEFSGFERRVFPKLGAYVCMAEYDQALTLPIAFPRVELKSTFGELIAGRGLTQLRIAETEKYAHVTFFFNGGEEKVFPGEDRVLVPSPREVATYDLKPEMSAPQITEEVLKRIGQDLYDVIILNFANADMVGHSGKLPAAIQAVETLDVQLGRIHQAIAGRGGTMLVTADHGNCERMVDEAGRPHTAHTLDLVPFLLIGEAWKGSRLRPLGKLEDIAPTMLQILGIPQPAEMTGRSMIV